MFTKVTSLIFSLSLLIISQAVPAFAHFGMIVPSKNIVTQDEKNINVNFLFAHPFEGIGMDLKKPKAVTMITDGKSTDLLPLLQETKTMDHKAWSLPLTFKRPGVYHLAMTPTPYWEEGEDIFIIHYTKTIISAFGADENWDTPMGLPTEIIPMTRPFANYTGNLFTGKVLLDNKPVPYAEIEVEYYNENGEHIAPSELHITQVVKSDENGVFSFVCPWKGWWGFSALNKADYTLKDPSGKEKEVELGAVFWLKVDTPLYTK
jgi:cobalt/nickel transport protein